MISSFRLWAWFTGLPVALSWKVFLQRHQGRSSAVVRSEAALVTAVVQGHVPPLAGLDRALLRKPGAKVN